MNTTIKYQSRTRNRENGSAIVNIDITYQGDYAALTEMQDLYPVNSVLPDIGKVSSSSLKQAAGDIWELNFKCKVTSTMDVVQGPDDVNSAVDTAWGSKSASMRGGRLSMPLESATFYCTKWNHYLFACGTDAVPAFWDNATNCAIDNANIELYRWGDSLSDLPTEKNASGDVWKVLKDPTKPGVNSYDVSTYTVTESARFKSADSAGKFCVNHLNKIGAPDETFGNDSGDWKCDDASVSWHGEYWLATLTWTHSGDEDGWDSDLYKSV